MVVNSGAPNLSGRHLRIAIWMAAIAASAVFATTGIAKLGGAMIGRFEQWGYAPSFAMTIGVVEVLGAIGLLIPRCSACAALGLIVIMFGALGTHVIDGDWIAALAPTLMLALLGFVVYGRGLGSEAAPSHSSSTELEWWI